MVFRLRMQERLLVILALLFAALLKGNDLSPLHSIHVERKLQNKLRIFLFLLSMIVGNECYMLNKRSFSTSSSLNSNCLRLSSWC